MTENKNPEVNVEKLDSRPGNNKPSKNYRTIKIVILVILLLMLIAGGTAATVIYKFIDEAPTLDPSRLEINQT
jgi:hypothetical protein